LDSAVTVEGVRVRGTPISQAALKAVWRTLTSKRFPRVVALQLADDAFDAVLERMRMSDSGRANARREVTEWGRTLSTGGTDACVFDTDGCLGVEYILLVRARPYHRLDEILEHELAHIARGDL
jgi:hypothetical protein